MSSSSRAGPNGGAAPVLALYLGMLDADFRVDEAAAPELAGYLGALSARYARAAQSATAE
jgi:hypothetical protein